MTVTNVAADAVNTIEWLGAANTTISVPVYQRHYRWDIGGCEQILADIRSVANGHAQQTHFIGSILFTATSSGEGTDRMLVDGQQRVATLMLLIAALRDILRTSDEAISGQLHTLLLHPSRKERTRLRLRTEGARELNGIVFDQPPPAVGVKVSHLQDNYHFFLEQLRDNAHEVWDGLQKLEHVAIALQQHANPQQVFESLNSTRTPLKNHELIHNYVLMGLTYAQQTEIEDSFWIPIEANTGDAIDNFLRDYLTMKTGRDSEFAGEHGVYDVFKKEFPRPRFETLTTQAAEWKTYAEVYRILLDPAREADEQVRRQLRHVNTFGAAMYPLLLRAYRDYQLGVNDRSALLKLLEQLQSLYLRKMVVGASRDHLAAQLCQKWQQYGYQGLADAVIRRTPSNERVSPALRHRPLPLAGYVLQRIDDHTTKDASGVADLQTEASGLVNLQIEHIFPQFPRDTWSGDGIRQWHAFSEVDRAKYREILPTVGNLTLLEQPLNAAASNKPFIDKQHYYNKSGVPSTQDLVNDAAWDLPTIEKRTKELTHAFLKVWSRPPRDDPGPLEHLVPILDAERKPGYYKRWETEFEYAVFRDEAWEVRNLKTLFNRIFKRLWDTKPTEVLEYSDSHGGPVFAAEERNRQFDALPGSHHLFMGLFPQWMLTEIQGVLDHLNMADDLFVKYSTDED